MLGTVGHSVLVVPGIWDFTTIKEILSNPVYIGAIASQKVNYRFKIGWMGDKKREDWIFNQLSGLQVVPAQAGQVFRQDHIEHPTLYRPQHPLKVGAVYTAGRRS